MSADYQGVRVTAGDVASGEEGTTVIFDDYVLVTAGRCDKTYVQVLSARDGSETHIITVKGIRR